jgi:hypothetical protein
MVKPLDVIADAAASTGSRTDEDDEVDVSLIRWMLSLSPSDRLDVLQGFVDSARELSRAGRRA